MSKEQKIVYIEWIDSTHGSGWEYKKTNHPVSKCETVGYLIKKNFREITVCLSRSHDDICGVMTIPIGAIKKMRFLDK